MQVITQRFWFEPEHVVVIARENRASRLKKGVRPRELQMARSKKDREDMTDSPNHRRKIVDGQYTNDSPEPGPGGRSGTAQFSNV
jgi:polynucleotide 5'-kinase involved in rRNA processing